MYFAPQYNGYIADVANQTFKRVDGKRFYFNHATATSFAPNQETTPITGGQGLAPLAYINGQQTLDLTFTSAEFSMDMFSAANGVNGSTAKEWVDETRSYVVSSNAITIPYKVNTEDFYIDGMEKAEGEPESEGKYKLEAQDGTSTITFHTGDFEDGDEVQVFFQREVENVHTMNTTTTAPSSRGEVIARWPVYAGSNDGAESAIKGYVQIMMPLARVTALPGFDTSYKSAATNAVTFSAMDAGRADELWYRIQFIPLG